MYADDVILMSSNSAGFKLKLDILQTFCEDWCLSISIVKTKVVILNKAGKLINSQSCSILIRQQGSMVAQWLGTCLWC